MRKITQQVIAAFNANQNFKSGNTQVRATEQVTELHLHGNWIAKKVVATGELQINNCGYETNTTKERLNGLPGVNISQKDFVWYLNGDEMPANQWVTV